jgi:hypothetical protein
VHISTATYVMYNVHYSLAMLPSALSRDVMLQSVGQGVVSGCWVGACKLGAVPPFTKVPQGAAVGQVLSLFSLDAACCPRLPSGWLRRLVKVVLCGSSSILGHGRHDSVQPGTCHRNVTGVLIYKWQYSQAP